MQVVSPEFVKDKKVLLRYDLDVLVEGEIEDFRLKAGLETLKMCLEHGVQVVMMGHLGRPEGKEVPNLSVAPIYEWLKIRFPKEIKEGKLKLLENLRFEPGEEAGDLEYAKVLVGYGEVYVNEAFASYHQAVSTTVLPTLMTHVAGLRFVREVRELGEVRDNPKRPLVAIIGGAKVEDKKPLIDYMAKMADLVLVGGKIAGEMANSSLPHNVLVGKLNSQGTDLTPETLENWREPIAKAGMILQNGTISKVDGEDKSEEGALKLAEMVLKSQAKVVTGGGDTVAFLDKEGLLNQFKLKGFVSTGGGAMLEFLIKGTLPTIEALK